MLFNFINRLEKKYPFFNHYHLDSSFLLKWLKHIGVIPLSDRTIKTALSFITPKKRKVTLYNPELQPDELILILGHELGHWLLGHVESAELIYNPDGLFLTSGIEKDAGIIGFLCWYPTPLLEKIYQQKGVIDPQELAWENTTCDTEWNFAVKIYTSRCRIYRAWKRVKLLL